MEIKQLEYFAAACDRGSFSRAAECLYTSQPNVSKVISSLEKELGRDLFDRNSKGIQLTPFGETVREYADSILKNVELISSLAPANPGEKLSISTYSSNYLAKLLVEYYGETEGNYVIEHLQGTVEEVTDHVKKGISEIGVVMLAEKHIKAFQHILGHKKLEFHRLGTRELCLIAGPEHPFYNRESVNFEELSELKFIRGPRDYFSMEHHLDSVSMGVLDSESLNNIICTESDFQYIHTLIHTDIGGLGVRLMGEEYWIHNVRMLPIKGCESVLVIGYVTVENHELSVPAGKFISLLGNRI